MKLTHSLYPKFETFFTDLNLSRVKGPDVQLFEKSVHIFLIIKIDESSTFTFLQLNKKI